jgi:O-antigen/teichoic acid export membrane protein
MGSNGFLIRRTALLETQYEPLVHSDVVGDLAARGWRFARVRQGVVHHHSRDLRAYARKARRRARRRLQGVPAQRHRFEPGSAALAVRVLDAVTLVGPAWRALRGYRRRPDRAWALYPVTTLITVGAYGYETLVGVVGRRAARAAVLLAATVAVSNAMNVVFQLAMARLLGPAEYSLLGTLFAVLMVLSVPTVGLQAVVAREVAQDLEAGDEAITGRRLRDTYASLGRATLWAVAVMAVAAVPLISLLHIQRPVPIATTAIAMMAALPLPVSWGALQGAARFGALSLSQISFSTAKLATGLVLALLGFGATAVMLGLALAGTAAVGLSVVSLRALLRRGGALAPRRRPLFTGYSVGAAAVLTAITALTMSDLVVARLSFSPEVSGAYNAASVAARLMLVLPIAVTTVLFPRVVTLADARSERRHLRAGLVAVGGASALVVVLFFVAAGPLIDAGFGSHYSAAAPWLGPLGVAMAGYAVLNVYAYHLLALGHARFALLLLAALAVQLALYAGFHASPGQLIAVQVVVALALVAASEAFARSTGRRFAREVAA